MDETELLNELLQQNGAFICDEATTEWLISIVHKHTIENAMGLSRFLILS